MELQPNDAPPAEVVDFRTYYQERTRLAATFLIAFTGLNFLVSPLYRLLLDMPVVPSMTVLVAEWVLALACFTVAWLRWSSNDTVFTERLTLVTLAVTGLVLVGWRYLWHQLGGSFFPGASALFFTVAITTSGVRYLRLFVVATTMLSLETVLSYYLHGVSAAANQDLLFNTIAMIVVLVSGWQVHHAVWQTWDEGRYFRQLSERDALTGLLNRRAFEERARRVLARGAQDGRSVVLAVVDFDKFLRFNERQGHLAGDRALKSFARLVSRFARQPLDLVARIDGEEFALLWYDVGEEWGASRATMLARCASEMSESEPGNLTASVGAVCGEAGSTELPQLWREVDGNLSEAKRRGGNTAVLTLREAAYAVMEPDAVASRRSG